MDFGLTCANKTKGWYLDAHSLALNNKGFIQGYIKSLQNHNKKIQKKTLNHRGHNLLMYETTG